MPHARRKQQAEAFVLERCNTIASTMHAVLVETEDKKQMWLPRSQLKEVTYNTGERDFSARVRMTAWVAKQNGLL